MRTTTQLGLLLCSLVMPMAASAALFGEDPVPAISAANATYETAFSTTEAASPLVVKSILSAKKTIRVAAHLFVSNPVSESLVKAQRSGVDVKVVLDKKSNETGYSNAVFLLSMGVAPKLVTKYQSLQSNYIVIDGTDIVTGDFAALAGKEEERKNPVAVLVIHNAPELAKQYAANWQSLSDAAEVMVKDKKK